MSGARRLKSSIWDGTESGPESQDWGHLLNHALETQPASEDLLQTQLYQPTNSLETQVYQPAEDYLQTQVYTATAAPPPADIDQKLTGHLKNSAKDYLQAEWERILEATKKNYLEPLEPTKQQEKRPLEHPLETTQLKPKWKKLRVTGDTGGTSGDEIVE